MSFVTSLTLSHFRSHKHVQLDLDKRPVAIFGPNGSGKTNIIEAVSLFFSRAWDATSKCRGNDAASRNSWLENYR
jgi:recombinational DNA repair ATPase RecF